MTTEEQMRAEFEDSILPTDKRRRPYDNIKFTRYDATGVYKDYVIEERWQSWQACQRMNDERNKLQEKPE